MVPDEEEDELCSTEGLCERLHVHLAKLEARAINVVFTEVEKPPKTGLLDSRGLERGLRKLQAPLSQGGMQVVVATLMDETKDGWIAYGDLLSIVKRHTGEKRATPQARMRQLRASVAQDLLDVFHRASGGAEHSQVLLLRWHHNTVAAELTSLSNRWHLRCDTDVDPLRFREGLFQSEGHRL